MRLLTNARRLALVVALAGCTAERRPPPGPPPVSIQETDPLSYTAPDDSLIPDGPMGQSIRRGRAILLATGDSLPDHVGNALRCTNCHLDAGTRRDAMPWLGVYARFPQYRSRNARINSIEDRINDCFQRSLNGKILAADDPALHDMVAYMAFLSQGVPVGRTVVGAGLIRDEPLPGDPGRGHAVFVAECARCHGNDGQGIRTDTLVVGPPLWGPRSYSVGAGMARVRTAAAFIRHNMPFDRPGTLTDQQAFDVATYVDSRSRPDFVGKEDDWPKGGEPPDVAYQTRAMRERRAPDRP